ncbi:MAG: orotate phosphoribosyltransferase PyrE [Saliniramus fredricksonii]|uniref:Orotate phosphoribosyltransferase n=1 Tax=Saliniramus fredricksonii TaxID=1653334 RepID=A0A0P7XYC0_9HYPH|nr:orotate phosphoribosyltransferase [Saliniramus fredricksonii]KPQ12713.1 MAG: orotate phosphoribosyltransferase PyrE [Saliniramus fredricksonii]SCC82610.1 orotate phosphoribosyltransferase [Saliniramus fredricksonii]
MTSFPDRTLIADMTAKMLLEVEAVHFRADEPFRFTSGWASPVYIDCRKLISFPRVRNTLMDFAASVILREVGFETLDAIAGGETAGIPFAAWIADRLSMPMQYVRKKPKGFGRDAQIEGHYIEGSRVLLVEDLTTDGRSKIKFVDAMRKSGLIVEHAFVVFHYDIFPQTKDMLRENGVAMHALATWWDVLRVARTMEYFDVNTLSEVETFLNEPAKWSAAHGGASELPSN